MPEGAMTMSKQRTIPIPGSTGPSCGPGPADARVRVCAPIVPSCRTSRERTRTLHHPAGAVDFRPAFFANINVIGSRAPLPRGTNMSFSLPSSSNLLRRRAALLGSVATMSMVLPTAVQAQAQQAVYAREGQTLGDVELSTGGRLILDISRVDPQTGALNLAENGGNPPVISGTLDADAAANSLWLIATQSQTRRLVNPTVTLNGANAGFENGIVYEAYGQDTLLTLAAPLRPSGDPTSRLTTVRLAGNGTINFASGIETGNSTAIKVEQDSTAALLGEDARRLDLIVSQWVQGTDMSAFSNGNTRALIDVTNAGSLTFEGRRRRSTCATAWRSSHPISGS